MMQQKDFVRLTKVLYKVSEFLPTTEPLRIAIREKANAILGDLVLMEQGSDSEKVSGRILGNIKVLQAYFKVSEEQNWVRKENFKVLAKEYNKIGEEIKGEKGERGEIKGEVKGEKGDRERGLGLKQRQGRILQVLREKQQAQIQDFKEIFPEITKRTLRRDFDQLLEKGLVQRIGAQNQTVYKLR